MLQIPSDERSTGKEQLSMMPWVGWTPANWQPMLSGFAAWTAKLGSTLSAAQGEYVAFVSRRTKEDLAFPAQLAACKSPDEIVQVYSSFLTRAASDYQKEYAALARIGADFATTSVDAARGFESRDQR